LTQLIGVTTADIITRKRKELAELEARHAEERLAMYLKVGDYARILYGGNADNFEVGEVVKVTKVDVEETYCYEVDGLLNMTDDSLKADQLERLTPAEAKAAILAQVEALFTKEAV
jgi:hypothetical protein